MSTFTAECLHSSTSFLEGSGFSCNSNTGLGSFSRPHCRRSRDGLESSWPTESLKSTRLNGQLPYRKLGGRYLDLQPVNHGSYIGSWSPFESCTTFPNRDLSLGLRPRRTRRRYEEIERLYKCVWMGCEKAYGTLSHLNTHIKGQSHGSKRKPEEFIEMRKAWKTRQRQKEITVRSNQDGVQGIVCNKFQTMGQTSGSFNHLLGTEESEMMMLLFGEGLNYS